MATAKVFRSGNSQAVRIPREFQFDTDEVEIERRGNEIILRRPVRNLRGAFDALAALPDDFFAEGREDSLPRASPAGTVFMHGSGSAAACRGRIALW